MSDIPYRVVLDSSFHSKKTVSYGLIVFALSSRRTLMVQRKHTAEFLTVLHGCFKSGLLPFLLGCITEEEAFVLRKLLFATQDELYRTFKELGLFYYNYTYAWEMWQFNRPRIEKFLASIDFQKNTLSWCWPKGRLSSETSYECARREFYEEVQVRLPPTSHRIKESFVLHHKTITNRELESRFWVYVVDREFEVERPEAHPEVADRRWFSLEECEQLLPLLPVGLCDALSKIS